MFRRALLRPALALVIATGAATTATIAAPVLTVTASAPTAVAQAGGYHPDITDETVICKRGQHLVGSTCLTDRTSIDMTTGTAKKVSGWGWVLLGLTSLGGLLAG